MTNYVYPVGIRVVNVLVNFFCKINLINNPNALEKKSSYIYCPNHISLLDPLIIATWLEKQNQKAHFLAKSELFEIPIFGRLLKSAEQVPVYRNTTRASEALVEAKEILKNNESVIIYPEGTSSKDLNLGKIKSGAIRLSQETNTPIIPIGVWGIHRIYSKAKKINLPSFPLKRVKVNLSLGTAILPDMWTQDMGQNLIILKTRMLEQLEVVRENYHK